MCQETKPVAIFRQHIVIIGIIKILTPDTLAVIVKKMVQKASFVTLAKDRRCKLHQ